MKTSVKQITTAAFLVILLVIGNTQSKATEVEMLKPAFETTLEIENWMMDEKLWEQTPFMNFEIAMETETDLELENWMTSETTWNTSGLIFVEMETQLVVETWMTCDRTWNFNETIIEEAETQLVVEDWMLSENIWNKK